MSKSISIPRSNGKTVNLSIVEETPNGTIYGVTPGGTKLVYKREQMLLLKHSPAAQTPPKLPNIPGVTTSGVSTATIAHSEANHKLEVKDNEDHRPNPEHDDDMDQFEMDA